MNLRRFITFEPSVLTYLAELRQATLRKRMLTLLLRERQLNAACPHVALQSGFHDALHFVKQARPETQAAVFSSPAFSLWLDTLASLIHRQAHRNYPEFHLAGHLCQLTRFAVSCGILQHERISLQCRLGPDGEVTFPATGLVIALGQENAFRTITVNVHAGSVSTDIGSCAQLLKRVQTGAWIDHWDREYRRCADVFTFPHLSEEESLQWTNMFEAALDSIKRVDAPSFQEIGAAISVLVPLDSSDPEIHESSSLPQAIGTIFMSSSKRRDAVAEAFIHEYFHNRFNLLLEFESVFASHRPEQLLFSPWKAEPRPPVMVLHGIIAFLGVTLFWLKALKAGEYIDRDWVEFRCAQLYAEVGYALKVLQRDAVFTPAGSQLLDGLIEVHDKTGFEVRSDVANSRTTNLQSLDESQAMATPSNGLHIVPNIHNEAEYAFLRQGTSERAQKYLEEELEWDDPQLVFQVLQLCGEIATATLMHKARQFSKLEKPAILNNPCCLAVYSCVAYASDQFEIAAELSACGMELQTVGRLCRMILGFSQRHLGQTREADELIFGAVCFSSPIKLEEKRVLERAFDS